METDSSSEDTDDEFIASEAEESRVNLKRRRRSSMASYNGLPEETVTGPSLKAS